MKPTIRWKSWKKATFSLSLSHLHTNTHTYVAIHTNARVQVREFPWVCSFMLCSCTVLANLILRCILFMFLFLSFLTLIDCLEFTRRLESLHLLLGCLTLILTIDSLFLQIPSILSSAGSLLSVFLSSTSFYYLFYTFIEYFPSWFFSSSELFSSTPSYPDVSISTFFYTVFFLISVMSFIIRISSL